MRKGRAGTANQADDENAGEQQRTIGTGRCTRLGRRIDHHDADRIGLDFEIAAQPRFFKLCEQLVVLILHDGVIAIEPVVFGRNFGFLEALRQHARQFALDLRLARFERGHRRLAFGAHRLERSVSGVGYLARSAARPFAHGLRAQRLDLRFGRDDVGMRVGQAARLHAG